MTYSKSIFTLIVATMLALPFAVPTYAATEITESPETKVMIDGGVFSDFKEVPIIINGHVLLPLRDLLVSLGVPDDEQHISWNRTEKTIAIQKDNTSINLKIGSSTAQVNGVTVVLGSAPVIYSKNGRTYIPARFVAESLGKHIEWEGTSRTVVICNESHFVEMKKLDQAIIDAQMKQDNFQLNAVVSWTCLDQRNDSTTNSTVFPKEKAMHSNELYAFSSIMANEFEPLKKRDRKSTNEHFLYLGKKWSRQLTDDSTDSFTTDWNESSLSGLDYNSELHLEPMPASYLASLVIRESASENELILESHLPLQYQEANRRFDPNIRSYSNIVIDKNTYLLKSKSFRTTFTIGADAPCNGDFKYVFNNYNSNVKLTIPDGIRP